MRGFLWVVIVGTVLAAVLVLVVMLVTYGAGGRIF